MPRDLHQKRMTPSHPGKSVEGACGQMYWSEGVCGTKRKYSSDEETSGDEETCACSDDELELAITSRFTLLINACFSFPNGVPLYTSPRVPYGDISSRRVGGIQDKQNKRVCVSDPHLTTYLQLFGESCPNMLDAAWLGKVHRNCSHFFLSLKKQKTGQFRLSSG